MKRMPLASASLLAIAISLAGCGDDRPTEPTQTAAQPAAASTTPAQPAVADESATKAVVAHYADMALAVFSDAHGGALELQKAIEALLAEPTEQTLAAALRWQARSLFRRSQSQQEEPRAGPKKPRRYRDRAPPGFGRGHFDR